MNLRLISYILGMIALIVAAFMTAALPWSFPLLGEVSSFDGRGFWGVFAAIVISLAVSGGFFYFGRSARKERLLRREAMASVALAWILATILGALPFLFTRTIRTVTPEKQVVPMNLFDALFEAASGYSCTGATVLTDVESSASIPRSVLFWRCETHFLGGLGIVVLFVAILGFGPASKKLVRIEAAAPSQVSTHEQTRSAAIAFGGVFVSLNLILVVLLLAQGLSVFDALCHAFGTVATGGFTTYNNSVAHFQNWGIELTLTIFMFLGCTNFALLYFASKGQVRRLLEDTEFQTYALIVAVAVTAVTICLFLQNPPTHWNITQSFRASLFQCVSIQTNTGFASDDFDKWPPFAKAVLLVLMYIGGCAGSTSCSVKVIRYIFLFKIFRLEIEHAYRPNVVRLIHLGGQPIQDPELPKSMLVYFALVTVISVAAWGLVLAVEPLSTWGSHPEAKLIDSVSAVAATINGVGPGFGICGPMSNYAAFHAPAKLILTLLMLLGRLELFPVLLLFSPRFWRTR